MKINNYINHIVFCVDASSSMSQRGLADTVIKVFDNQIKYLARRSKELDQETRVSLYFFADKTECVIYDKDVLRLPSLKDLYKPYGNTALIDANLKAIDDLEKTAQLYGDHAFLIYTLTDGEENRSHNSAASLEKRVKSLPENWTLAVFVPNQQGVFEAKKFGFPQNNIAVWSTTQDGAEEVGKTMETATEHYMVSRATGIRSTKNLFNIDVSNLDKSTVSSNLDELPASQYEIIPVRGKTAVKIKEYIENYTRQSYRLGSAYYSLSKVETIQPSKQICIQNKVNGRVYSGLKARKLIGLPDYEVKVNPVDYGEYSVFVQSTSVNRNLIPGQNVLVMK